MNKQKQNLALYSLLMVVLAMFGLYYFGMPMLAGLKDINLKIADKQKENLGLQEKIANILNIKNEIDSNPELGNLLNLAMPNGDDASGIIETLKTVASNYSLELSGIREIKSNNADNVTFEVGLVGSYKSIKMFTEDIEKNIRVAQVTKMTIQKEQSVGDSSVKASLNIDFIKLGVSKKGDSNE